LGFFEQWDSIEIHMLKPENAGDGSSQEKKPVPSPIGDAVNRFIEQIEGLARSLPIVMAILQLGEKEANKRLGDFLSKYGALTAGTSDSAEREYSVPLEQILALRPLQKRHSQTVTAQQIVPRTMFTALVSQFDSYLGSLLRAIFIMKPEVLNGSDKVLTFSQLATFASIEEARDSIIEKEIEGVLRESHAAHFKWMENKFGLPLTKGLISWPLFIELTERRNLFVHTGGVVSSQYLKVCEEYKVNFSVKPLTPDIVLGEQLEVSYPYFQKSYRVIYEIGIKLAHVLWRKLFPDDLKQADENLLDISYFSIVSGDHLLAQKVNDFAAAELPRYSSEDVKRRLIINRAQSYKWGGDQAQAKNILDREDWTATSDVFRLAVSVLKDEFDAACAMMRKIGDNGDMHKNNYRDWPIFKLFRQNSAFVDCYKEIFKEEFVQMSFPDHLLFGAVISSDESNSHI
jgi:hypothetical protein